MFAASLEDPRCESGSERLGRSGDSPWNVADRASLIALPPFHPYRTWNHPIPLGLPPYSGSPGSALTPQRQPAPGCRLPCSRIPGLLRWTLSGVESSCASMTKSVPGAACHRLKLRSIEQPRIGGHFPSCASWPGYAMTATSLSPVFVWCPPASSALPEEALSLPRAILYSPLEMDTARPAPGEAATSSALR